MDSYKAVRQIDEQDLVVPQVKITTKILNFKSCLDNVLKILPVRPDGRDSLPDKIKRWLVDDEARALLRNGQYQTAYEAVAVQGPLPPMGQERDVLVKSQISFLELSIASALDSCDKTNMLRARSKALALLNQFDAVSAGYASEVVGSMEDLIALLEGGDDALKSIERVSRNKRAPVLRAFFYHPTCKLAEYLIKDLTITLAACRETISISSEYTEKNKVLEAVAYDLVAALKQPVKLRVQASRTHRDSIGSQISMMLNVAGHVKKQIGKSGCHINSDDIMKLDILVSRVYENFSSCVCTGGVDCVTQLLIDFKHKVSTEFALHIDGVNGSGMSDAFDDVQDISALECLSGYTMLPKEAAVVTTQMTATVISMLSNIAKLMVALQLGGHVVTNISCNELTHCLGKQLDAKSVNAKFVEVLLTDSIGAINHVGRLY